MSSDLFEAFANPKLPVVDHPTEPTGLQAEQDFDQETDDFGAFEGPEIALSGQAPSVKSKPYVGAATSISSDLTRESGKHGQESEARTSDISIEGWGDFNDDTVISDADQQFAMETERIIGDARSKSEIVEGHEDEDLDDFEAWEPQPIAQAPIVPAKPNIDSVPARPMPNKASHSLVERRSEVCGLPPTNIPPPSMLLSLCASIFQSLPTDIKSSTVINQGSDQPFSEQANSDMRQLISTLRCAAHIQAGRKLRWKRDDILSQSMKIGSAGKPGGMKLAGLDKAEARREDQEAAEVLQIWRQNVGPLRISVAKINSRLPDNGFTIPEISENMPVRMAKYSEGAITAPKCCFLCGLNRDDRVLKIDLNIEDSFGEWWTEGWGHKECVNFWSERKSSLIQR